MRAAISAKTENDHETDSIRNGLETLLTTRASTRHMRTRALTRHIRTRARRTYHRRRATVCVGRQSMRHHPVHGGGDSNSFLIPFVRHCVLTAVAVVFWYR